MRPHDRYPKERIPMIKYSTRAVAGLFLLVVTGLLLPPAAAQGADRLITVKAARDPGDPWKTYQTRILAGLGG